MSKATQHTCHAECYTTCASIQQDKYALGIDTSQVAEAHITHTDRKLFLRWSQMRKVKKKKIDDVANLALAWLCCQSSTGLMISPFWHWLDVANPVLAWWHRHSGTGLIISPLRYWLDDIATLIVWYWLDDIATPVLAWWHCHSGTRLMTSPLQHWLDDIATPTLAWWCRQFGTGLMISPLWYWLDDIATPTLAWWCRQSCTGLMTSQISLLERVTWLTSHYVATHRVAKYSSSRGNPEKKLLGHIQTLLETPPPRYHKCDWNLYTYFEVCQRGWLIRNMLPVHHRDEFIRYRIAVCDAKLNVIHKKLRYKAILTAQK